MEVGQKLVRGLKLTREEWEEAREKEILKASGNVTYEGFLATYYQDDKVHGYICSQHKHRDYVENDQEWQCMWGLHLEDLRPKYLTDLNAMFIALCFGREALKEVGKGFRNPLFKPSTKAKL